MESSQQSGKTSTMSLFSFYIRENWEADCLNNWSISKGAEIPMKTHTITESEFVTIPI